MHHPLAGGGWEVSVDRLKVEGKISVFHHVAGSQSHIKSLKVETLLGHIVVNT